MATLDTTRTTYGAASVAGHLTRMMQGAAASFAAWNDARLTRNALSELTDRELEDIGLSRADLDNVALGRR